MIKDILVLLQQLDAHINRRGCGLSEPTGRVYNGYTIQKPQIPWIVQILADTGTGYGQLCAGSVISHNVILTAAHCVESEPPVQRILIYYNTTKPNDGPVTYAERLVKHPGYDRLYAVKYDIALLKVTDRIRFDRFVRPICLQKRPIPLNGRKLMSGGWGNTNDREPPDHAKTLFYITFQAISRLACHVALSAVVGNGTGGFDAKYQLCAITFSGTLCKGDSGAPVTMWRRNGQSVQVGVNSLVTKCNERGKFLASVRVAEFMPWIKRSLRNPESWETLPTAYA